LLFFFIFAYIDRFTEAFGVALSVLSPLRFIVPNRRMPIFSLPEVSGDLEAQHLNVDFLLLAEMNCLTRRRPRSSLGFRNSIMEAFFILALLLNRRFAFSIFPSDIFAAIIIFC